MVEKRGPESESSDTANWCRGSNSNSRGPRVWPPCGRSGHPGADAIDFASAMDDGRITRRPVEGSVGKTAKPAPRLYLCTSVGPRRSAAAYEPERSFTVVVDEAHPLASGPSTDMPRRGMQSAGRSCWTSVSRAAGEQPAAGSRRQRRHHHRLSVCSKRLDRDSSSLRWTRRYVGTDDDSRSVRRDAAHRGAGDHQPAHSGRRPQCPRFVTYRCGADRPHRRGHDIDARGTLRPVPRHRRRRGLRGVERDGHCPKKRSAGVPSVPTAGARGRKSPGTRSSAEAAAPGAKSASSPRRLGSAARGEEADRDSRRVPAPPNRTHRLNPKPSERPKS